MIALVLCVVALLLTFSAGRYSLGKGLVALLFVGYCYGIVRANVLSTFTYFFFDAAVMGLYLSQFFDSRNKGATPRSAALNFWVILLILWPTIVIFLPFQPLLVSLVGFRGITFFIPMLLLGTRLREKDLVELCYGLLVLNLIAGGFAAAEYVLGVPRFYPRNAVTAIIYASSDVAGHFFRIPATFVNAHGYGTTMVFTLPFLLGFWNRSKARFFRWLTVLSLAAALLGILASAARVCFLMGAFTVAASLFTGRMTTGRRIIFVVILGGMAVLTLGSERLQRFKSLGDTDYVSNRIAGSVNRGFWEILADHPMGNGLGGGGTSMPYFLEGEVRNPIGLENEYAMVLAEQGIVGLLFWFAFVVWFLTRAPVAFARGPWDTTRRTGWCIVAFSLCTAWIGIGLLNAIPGAALLLLIMGWTAAPRAPELRGTPELRRVAVSRHRELSVPSVS